MHKPLHLLAGCLSACICFAQKSDTLILLYKPDQFVLSRQDQQKLDSFVQNGWDRIFINGYTDETETEDYNLELSKKRSAGVVDYFTTKGIDGNIVSSKYFGESMPVADNASDDGRALNRRTEIVGYRYPRVKLRPIDDPMKPVTQRLDNGFIITFRPGAMPSWMAANFRSGSGIDFELISNTTQMRENNLYTNTTSGDILSSMQVVSFDERIQCKLDSPVLMRVPVRYETNCSFQKLKFFVAVWENGRTIWKEENKPVFMERINGINYACVWVDNFCGSVNFDFKIPECYDTDSTQLLIVNANVKNLVAELEGLNSVYLPQKLGDSLFRLVYLKNRMESAALTFSVYKGKKRVKGYANQRLSSLPFNASTRQYVISTQTVRFYFSDVEPLDVLLKINKDKYRVPADSNMYEFTYLNRSNEKTSVDFIVAESKRKVSRFTNQSLASLPYDEVRGCYVIDKNFLKTLKQTHLSKATPDKSGYVKSVASR